MLITIRHDNSVIETGKSFGITVGIKVQLLLLPYKSLLERRERFINLLNEKFKRKYPFGVGL
jgi:hypothetical protein